MSRSRAEILINKLISNKLSGDELSELLEGINDENDQEKYSDALRSYFDTLMEENKTGHAQNGHFSKSNDST